MICAACHTDTRPVHQMTAKGMVARCPEASCGAPWRENGKSEAPTPPPTPKAAPAISVTTQSAAAPTVEQDMVAMVRARLGVVQIRIAELRGLEAEEKQLTAMLDAAERLGPGVKSTKPVGPIN